MTELSAEQITKIQAWWDKFNDGRITPDALRTLLNNMPDGIGAEALQAVWELLELLQGFNEGPDGQAFIKKLRLEGRRWSHEVRQHLKTLKSTFENLLGGQKNEGDNMSFMEKKKPQLSKKAAEPKVPHP